MSGSEEGPGVFVPAPPALARIRPGQVYAWCGPSILIVTPEGRIEDVGRSRLRTRGRSPKSDRPSHAAFTGFFFRQTRYLSRIGFELDGERPYLCSVAETSPHRLELAFVHPPVEKGGGGGSGSGASGSRHGLLFRDLDLRLVYEVHPASFTATLVITNRWQEDARVDFAWLLGADFASMDEVHFGYREEEIPVGVLAGEDGRPTSDVAGVVGPWTRIARFRSGPIGKSATMLETVARATVHAEETRGGEVDPAELRKDGHRSAYELENASALTASRTRGSKGSAFSRLKKALILPRQTPVELRLEVRALDGEHTIDEEGERRREARVRGWRASTAHVQAPGDAPLVEMTERALGDLGSFAHLEGEEDEWLTPTAGAPLYLMLWGRDALTGTWQSSLFDRGEMLADVLRRLTRLQGSVDAPDRDEEPGRILNQGHTEPRERPAGEPLARSYADFASPFDFIIGLGYRWALTGDPASVEPHLDAARRVLEWARTRADRNRDGYLEYVTRAPKGPTHQGWKDSENAVVDGRGEQVQPPIAPCEVQGYWYVSLQIMAALSGVTGDGGEAQRLWREASDLKERFNRDFWMGDEGYLAFGLDAEGRQIRAITSNPGQCLATGIVSGEHVERLVRRMFEPDLFSGWGIRTLSTENPAYNPLDYHLGSVWPVENGTILFGLQRYGLTERVHQLAGALYDLAKLWPGGRTPECVGGYARTDAAHPGVYPRANAPQMWNQSVFPILVQSLLGIVPFAPLRLLLVDPHLPSWLPSLTVRNLRVGDAALDLRFERDGKGRTDFEVLEVRGETDDGGERGGRAPIRVIRQPWLQSMSADVWERMRDLLEGGGRRRSSGGGRWRRQSKTR